MGRVSNYFGFLAAMKHKVPFVLSNFSSHSSHLSKNLVIESFLTGKSQGPVLAFNNTMERNWQCFRLSGAKRFVDSKLGRQGKFP